jgi:hypothetical protein
MIELCRFGLLKVSALTLSLYASRKTIRGDGYIQDHIPLYNPPSEHHRALLRRDSDAFVAERCSLVVIRESSMEAPFM